MKHWPYLLMGVVIVVVFGSRWFGPSDLYDNDQPKTVAYTVDMVRHGHWVLPEDMLGRPATKPPMYNWIGAPVVAAGWHNEFALKLPSTLAAFVVLCATWLVARIVAHKVAEHDPSSDKADTSVAVRFSIAFTALACIGVLANYSITKLAYTARPDMVLTGFLTVGWAVATWLLTKHERPVPAVYKVLGQIVLWLCVAGAALTKGPPALLLVIYVLLGGKLLSGRWSWTLRSGIVWGLPTAAVLFGMWAYGAYQADPKHFTEVFLGYETVNRVGRGGFVGLITECWKMPAFFMARFFPWSIFALMGAWHMLMTRPRREWFNSPLGPAMLWVVLVLVFFSLSGGKRADYLAPVYPAGAVLSAFWLMVEGPRIWRLNWWQPAVAGLVFAAVVSLYECCWSPAAVDGYGDRIVAFSQDVHRHTQGQPIHFEHTGYTPIQALLGYNQPPDMPDEKASGTWLIQAWDHDPAILVSDKVVDGDADELQLALYPDTSR